MYARLADSARIAQIKESALESTNSLVLPGVLLILSSVFVLYRHLTQGLSMLGLRDGGMLIAMQMVPMVALKLKLYSVTDRVGMLRRFSTKVLLMHLVFISIRVSAEIILIAVGAGWSHVVSIYSWDFLNDVTSLIALVSILKRYFNFERPFLQIFDHRDVVTLVVLASASGIAMEALDAVLDWKAYSGKRPFVDNVIVALLFAQAEYIEVLTFMPAVWLLIRMEPDASVFKGLRSGSTAEDFAALRKQTEMFFTWLISFYVTEDLICPVVLRGKETLVLCGHATHFMLLLDFSGFFLSQAVMRSKEKQQQGFA